MGSLWSVGGVELEWKGSKLLSQSSGWCLLVPQLPAADDGTTAVLRM